MHDFKGLGDKHDESALQASTSTRLLTCHDNKLLRSLFSLHDDVNDAHPAGANRLQNKNKMLGERVNTWVDGCSFAT